MINPEYRGKGYAVESMRMSVEFALEELGVEGISCQVLEGNGEMLGLVERKFGWVGVRKEGRWGREVRFEVRRGKWDETKERREWK